MGTSPDPTARLRGESGENDQHLPPLPHLEPRSSIGDVVVAAFTGPTGTIVDSDPVLRRHLDESERGADPVGAVGGPDGDLVHRTRVAARRLRSNLSSLRPFLDRPIVDPLRLELRWLGGSLGRVRDAQILRAELVTHEGTRLLVADLDEQLVDDERALRNALESERCRTLLSDLLTAALSPPYRSTVQPDQRALPLLMERNRATWRQLRSAAATAAATGGDADVHELRKVVKRARYLAQLSSPVVGHEAERATDRLAALQDQLGLRQDAIDCQAWLARESTRLDSPTAFLAGQLEAAARFAPARSADWEPAFRRALKHRPSRGR